MPKACRPFQEHRQLVPADAAHSMANRPLVSAGRLVQVSRPAPLSEGSQPALEEAVLAARLKGATLGALNPAQSLETLKFDESRERIATLARTHPDQVAQLLRTWMARRRA